MAKCTAVLSKRARKQLDKLSDNIAEPIFIAIFDLENNPRPIGYKKLNGGKGYRIRIFELTNASFIMVNINL